MHSDDLAHHHLPYFLQFVRESSPFIFIDGSRKLAAYVTDDDIITEQTKRVKLKQPLKFWEKVFLAFRSKHWINIR